jgi:hypothetical protein
MPTFKIALDQDTFERLTDIAIAERRPIPWQAEVVLRQALCSTERPIRTQDANEETHPAHPVGERGREP